RGIAHRGRKLLEQLLVPPRALHQLDRLLGADPAGRALAAALVLEEAHEVQSHALHVVFVGENHDGGRADEAAVRLERAEVERDVRQRGRQDAARRPAGQIALEDVALRHAAAIFLDQLVRGNAGGSELHARLLDAARDREAAQSLASVTALAGEPGRTLLHDVTNPVKRLDVVNERGAAEETHLGRIGRLVARQPAFALEALEHRRLFAADVGSGTPPQVE